MSAAETIPFTAHRPVSPSPPPPVSPSQTLNLEPETLNPPRPWSPTDRDRLIFQWVRFDGHKQSWVASQLGMHQTTVSRIVDRYERWIAHGGPSQEGGLSRDERLRAQRWLTYERNEWILSSALRIAGEMEHPTDTSKSTITRSPQSYSQETEVRTQHAVLHRSGIAARFLRLAHRINMDQLKLIEQEPLPDLEPLADVDVGWAVPTTHDPADVAWAEPDVMAGSPDPATSPTEGLPDGELPPASIDSQTPKSSSMHKTHNKIDDEQHLTNYAACDYGQNQPAEKTSTPAYAVANHPPEITNSPIVPSQRSQTASFSPNPLPLTYSPLTPAAPT